MSDNKEIEFVLGIGLSTCQQKETVSVYEISKDWDKLTEEQQENACEEYLNDWVGNYIDAGYYKV